jgi:hypothetical protein
LPGGTRAVRQAFSAARQALLAAGADQSMRPNPETFEDQ